MGKGGGESEWGGSVVSFRDEEHVLPDRRATGVASRRISPFLLARKKQSELIYVLQVLLSPADLAGFRLV